MEVEAKFGIPDGRTFQRLLKATALAGFSLEEPGVAELHDGHLDPADGAFRSDILQTRHQHPLCGGYRSVAELNASPQMSGRSSSLTAVGVAGGWSSAG